MAGKKVSSLSIRSPEAGDFYYMIKDSGGSFVSYRVSVDSSGTFLKTELASTASGDGASLVGVEDAGSNFAGTNVETVLAEIQSNVDSVEANAGGGTVDFVSNVDSDRILGRKSGGGNGNSQELSLDSTRTLLDLLTATNVASTTNGQGASLVGVEDAAAHFSGADVEAVLAELQSNIDSVEANGGGSSDFLTNVDSNRIIGRKSGGGAGNSQELTLDSTRALLDLVTATDLAAVTNGDGASLVGVEDAAANFTGTDVEAVLAELQSNIDSAVGGSSFLTGVDSNRIIGRVSSGNGNSEELTLTQVRAFLDLDAGEVANTGEVIFINAGGSSLTGRPSSDSSKSVIWYNHGSNLPVNMFDNDIAMGEGSGVAVVNTVAATSYTLDSTDIGKSIDMTSASSNTVTIPPDSDYSFEIGTVMNINQLGAGTTTISSDSAVTVNGSAPSSTVINTQYSGVMIRKTAADTWLAQGDFA